MRCPMDRARASAGLSEDESSRGPLLHEEVGHRTTARAGLAVRS